MLVAFVVLVSQIISVVGSSCVSDLCECVSGKTICKQTDEHQFGSSLPLWIQAPAGTNTVEIQGQTQLKKLQTDGFLFYKNLLNVTINGSTNLDTLEEGWNNGINQTLKELYIIEATKLFKLPWQFLTTKTSLVILQISGTSIVQVHFLHGTKGDRMSKIILSGNQINSIIPGSFRGFPRLYHIDLRDNRLISIDKCTIEHLVGIMTRLYLGQNDWVCSCPMAWVNTLYVTTGRLIAYYPDEASIPRCAQPQTKFGEPLMNVSITGCTLADTDWRRRNCSGYYKDADGYLTTIKPKVVVKNTPNMLVVTLIVAGGLVLIAATACLCCCTYNSLVRDMQEAAAAEAEKGDDWWKDESGGGLKFGSGGGDGGILSGSYKTRNPFKKFLVPFVRRNFANASHKTTNTKKPGQLAKKYNSLNRQGKLRSMKRKEISSVTKQMSTMKKSRRGSRSNSVT